MQEPSERTDAAPPADADREPAAGGHARRRRTPLRNPYVWAFLIGIVTLTAIRPLLRREPPPPPVLGQVPAFTLVDQRGQPRGSAELAGSVYVANFFFTSCRSICPRLMDAMARLDRRYRERGIDAIELVSISVDPETDTPERLAEYAAARGIDAERWTLLTGEPAAVRELVEGGFRTGLGPVEQLGGGLYDIAHSGKFVIVDARGGIRGYYDSDETGLDEIYHRSQHVVKQERERRE